MKLVRYSLLPCLVTLISAFAAAPLAQVFQEVNPKIVPLQQEQSRWCWAAADAMVMRRAGFGIDQCQIVQDKTGLPGCCPATQGVCNEAGNSILVNGYGWKFKHTPAQQTWTQIIDGINKNLPFQFVWKYVPSGSHVMVGSAYVNIPLARVKMVGINEPDGGYFSWIDYSAYVGRPGSYASGANHYEMEP